MPRMKSQPKRSKKTEAKKPSTPKKTTAAAPAKAPPTRGPRLKIGEKAVPPAPVKTLQTLPETSASANVQPVAKATETRILGARSAPPRTSRKRPPVVLPPILLEGDASSVPSVSGPGERYAIRPPSREREVPLKPIPTELPDGYGSEQLFLTARDPLWLYAAWDLTPAQRDSYNAQSRDGHLIIRIYQDAVRGNALSETHVHRESKSWFLSVERGGQRYQAELGFYTRENVWQRVALSASTLTPPDSTSRETTVEFATIPPNVPLKKLFAAVQEAVIENAPLEEAVQQLRSEGWTELPAVVPTSPPEWTPAQARALAEVVRLDDSRRVWMGSVEITELIRRHLQLKSSSPAPLPTPGGPSAPLLESIALAGPSSSVGIPEGRESEKRSFWININAELVLYGATEPGAKVSADGREVKLRPDGTFSYRFALPDGQYPLELRARSADGREERVIRLYFSRGSEYRGAVEVHPQDPSLKPPQAAHLADTH